jgi:predicted dehydrogenase/acetyltransferase-like isoleucine patch superfamily enzyme
MTKSKIFENKALAVIGSGYWGKNLVRNYYQLDALKLICDKDETKLELFSKQYPEVETCMAFNEVLRRDDIQAVVLATPAETHFSLASEALLAGKHVYVEKPLVLHEADAEELIQLTEDRNLTLMVGHLLQYHPIFVRLKELVASGDLGRINYIYSHRLNLGKIRREENILWSFAPHDISMILALTGEEPESVLATGGNYLHRRIADVTTTHLDFPSGIKAHIFVSWLHPFKEQKLVVVGDRKMAVFDDTKLWAEKLLLYPHEIKWENNIPVPAKAESERVVVPENEPLRLECEHFLRCISNGERPLTDGQEGLRVLKILNASQRSLDKYVRGRGFDDGKSPDLEDSKKEMEPNEIPIEQDRVFAVIKSEETQHAPSPSERPYFLHPTAIVDEKTEVGSGSKIWHFSHILSNSRIGSGCNVGQNVVIGPDVMIGNKCKIQNNVSVYKGVTLEDGVFCGPSMVFTNVYNPRAQIRKMDQVRQTLVKEGATIGANATIICGITIGRYAFVGAGAVVNKNVPDYALVVGNPSRQIGWVCNCGERLPDDLECLTCGTRYEKKGDLVNELKFKGPRLLSKE